MNDKELNKRYRKIIRSHPRSGATWQRVKEIDCTPATDAHSPYWEDVKSRRVKVGQSSEADADGFVEHHSASGDGRAFNQTGDLQSLIRETERVQELQGRVHTLLTMSKQILTEQQYNVFVMLAIKEPHLTEREAAKVLSITPGRVHQLWVKAQKKLQKAYEERT